MHEIGVVEDLISSIQEKITDQAIIRQVKKIHLRLGKTAAVAEESLKFWFENLSQGTKLEGALLEISWVDGSQIFMDSLEVE